VSEIPDEISTFQDVGRLFPGETNVRTVPSGTMIRDALKLMLELRYSQLPIVDDGRVRGVFSLWSLARQVASTPKMNPAELSVEDVMENVPTVTVDDSLHEVLDLLSRFEALLVGSPRGLQAIATQADMLRYFYSIARPFVLLQEIELALRAVILRAAPGEKLQQCIDNAIRGFYEKVRKKEPPSRLEDMTFEDYRMLIISAKNWPLFQDMLGRNVDFITTRLERIRDLRNDVFHFRSDLAVVDHQTLALTRDWLLDKLRAAGVLRREVVLA
jgi:CBS domain-containing protein